MQAKAKQALVERLAQIAAAAISDQTISVPISSFPAKSFHTEESTFTIAGEAYHEYNLICRDLLRERGWAAKFSEEHVESAVGRALTRIVTDGNTGNAAQYVDEMVAAFEGFTGEYIVLVMVEGIDMRLRQLQIGPVTLRRLTDDYIEERMRDATAAIMAMDQVQEQKDARIARRREVLKDHLAGKVCMECHIQAEPVRAEQRAIELCRQTLGILRYALPAFYPELFLGESYSTSDNLLLAGQANVPLTERQRRERDERRRLVGIGLAGETAHSTAETACLSADGANYTHFSHATGPRYGLLIYGYTEAVMQSLGVFAAADILTREDRSDFEQRILRGIHWFANALVQIERENELTSLVTVLETFLAPWESDRISNKIAEGVAFVLTEDPDERTQLSGRVKDLYALRSKVSHGTPIPFTGADLDELTTLVMRFLRQMVRLRSKFASAKALNEWMEKQRRSGGWGGVFA